MTQPLIIDQDARRTSFGAKISDKVKNIAEIAFLNDDFKQFCLVAQHSFNQ